MAKKPNPKRPDTSGEGSGQTAAKLRAELAASLDLTTDDGRKAAALKVREVREETNLEAHRLREEASALSELLREFEPQIDRVERARRRGQLTSAAIILPKQ